MQAGACYYAQLTPDYFASMGAVTLADVLHGFYAESTLMADDYVAPPAGTPGAQPSSPMWRSHLQLLDATGTPRSHKAVRVWSDVTATVVHDGASYDVGPGQPVWLTTDSAGELALSMVASPASSAASGKGLGCAALYVWGSFMQQGEAIVLYPDHDTLTSLSTVRGTHLSAATSYDGTALLPSSYTPTDATQLASAIRSTMGATGQSLSATQSRLRRRAGLGRPPGRPPRGIRGASPEAGYIAYPGSVTNLVYQPAIGPTGRAYVPGAVPQWTASVTGGKVTFSPGVTRRPFRRPPGSVLGDFEDFLHDVVHGVEEVASVVWKAAVSAAQEVYTIAGKVYSFVVTTIEQAAAVVAALLKTVVGDLVRVVEALSFVLSWESIVTTHTAIRTAVTSNVATLATAAAGIAQGGQVQTFFDGIADAVGTDFSTMEAALTGRTVAGSNGQRTNPSALYGQGGAKAYTPTRWMTEKVRQNVGQAATGTAAAGLVLADNGFLATLESLATTISQQLSASFSTLPADLRTAVAAFGHLFSDASHAGGILLADLLQVLGDVVTGVLRFTGALLGDALAVLSTIVDGVVAALTATVQIPVLSELYQLVAGGPLSFLDLLCLVVAIPTTLVHEALALAAATPGHAVAATGPTLLQLAGVMTLGIFAVIDPLNAFAASVGQDFPPGYSLLWCANVVAALALGFPAAGDRSVATIVFWAFQVFPLALTFWGMAQSSELADVLVFVTSLFAQMLYGIAMLGASIGMAVTGPASWRGTDDLVAVQNCLGFVPYIGSPLLANQGAGATVEVGVTAVFDVAVAGVAAAQLFT